MSGDVVPVRFEDVDLAVRPSADHEWLLTTAEVAAGLGVSEGSVYMMKTRRSSELVEGRHFVTIADPSTSDGTLTIREGGPARTLWTKRGVVRLGFWARSDRARRFRDWAEDLVIAADSGEAPAAVAPMPTHIEALRGWADALERAQTAEATVAELAPKAEAFDEGMSREGLLTITDFAKKYDYPPRKIFTHLVAHGWIFKNGRGEYRERVEHQEHFEVRDTGRTYTDGVAGQQLYLNPQGQEALRRWLKQFPVPGTKRRPGTELALIPDDGAA